MVTATIMEESSESEKPTDNDFCTPRLSLIQLTSNPPHVMAAPHLPASHIQTQARHATDANTDTDTDSEKIIISICETCNLYMFDFIISFRMSRVACS